jgi:hypothetical protein
MDIKTEIEVVKKVGEKIGYGHMMEIASALWRQKLRDSKTPETGAFIAVLSSDVKEEAKERSVSTVNHYDRMLLEHE